MGCGSSILRDVTLREAAVAGDVKTVLRLMNADDIDVNHCDEVRVVNHASKRTGYKDIAFKMEC